MSDLNFQRRFLRLAIANIISNLMVPLAGLIDTAFLGHLAEIRHLAGVALATIIFTYIYWTFGFLRMATTGTTAQASGRNDPNAVLLTLLRNSIIAVSIGVILIVLQYPIRELGFAILSAEAEVKNSGISYYNNLIWGAIATLLNFVVLGWFLGREQSGKVLLLSAVNNGSNVLLNYLFIVRFGLESAGAGMATAASQYLMLIIGIILIARENWLAKIPKIAKQIFDRDAMKAIFILNSDITIRTFFLISAFAIFNNFSAALGTIVLATNTLLLQVITLAAFFIDGIAFATESFAGSFRGQGKEEQLKPLLRLSMGISFSLGLAFPLIFSMFPQHLFGLLTNHNNIIEQIDTYLIWLWPILGFGSIAFILDGYFLGLTEGGILRNSSIIASAVCFLPMALVAIHSKSTHLLWFAFTLLMLGRAATLAWQVPKTFNYK